MIQFNLNQDLANDLANLSVVCNEQDNPDESLLVDIQPLLQHEELGAMVWFAHEITLNNQKCVIAMEWRSGYVMVFCGLTHQDFNDFEMLFTQRFWREACVVTQLDAPLPEEDIAIITGLALELSQQQCFYVQTNYSAQKQIHQVKELLRQWVLEENNALPIDDDEALQFGLAVNEMLRSHKGSAQEDNPIEVYKSFWLGFVSHVQEKYAQDKPVQPTDDPFCIKEVEVPSGLERQPHSPSYQAPSDEKQLNSNSNSNSLKAPGAPASNVIEVDFTNKHKR